MNVTLPDPNPGRCLNWRNGQRCLDYEVKHHVCQFPEPPVIPDIKVWSMQSSDLLKPEPWVSPLEGEPT